MTKVFLKFLSKNTQIRHFWSKIPKNGIFGPKFGHFFFWKFCKLDKCEGADFKYDNIIFKFQSKNTKIRHSWSQIQAFSFLHQTLQQDKFDDADFKYDINVFKFQPQNTEIWHFWSQISEFLFFAQNKGNSRVLISNMTMVFQNCGLKHPNKAFLIPNLRILIFARNFAIRQFGGR